MRKLITIGSNEEQIIRNYLKKFENEISKLGIKPEFLRMEMFDLEHYLRFFSIRNAKSKGSGTVNEVDVENAIEKFGNPEKFVKYEYINAKMLQKVQSSTLGFFGWMEKKLDELRGPIVLDAGCGWGRTIMKLHDYYGKDFEMIGVDTNDLSLRYGSNLNKLLKVVESSNESLPFTNDVFDLVLCTTVLHDVKARSERAGILEEFHRVLKPKGALCIMDVFSSNSFMHAITRILQYLKSSAESVFPKSQLEKMLKENGFEIVDTQKMHSRWCGTILAYTIISIKEGT